MVKFLVLALFYGDHPQLARRCGATLRALWNTGQVDLRIGLNEVSAESRAILDALLPGVQREQADPQIYKYPMMRRLLAGYSGDATHLMWFDDDSFLRPGLDVKGWLQAVSARAATARGSLGSVYTQQLDAAQQAWIRARPWYRGLDVPGEVAFNTGGWFVVPLELIRRCGWPEPELRHDGGDRILGALLHQQGLAPQQFRVGLAINSDEAMHESGAPRRGLDLARPRDLWTCEP
ncbi:hypothetical protein WG902_05160 [Ramlibacter sp. PS3R-8]|uniref:hypothetical protein n=1 Tax=Ramlibacter sp. PS3R-8 TaxID=3133437 RepID=UPI003096D0B3